MLKLCINNIGKSSICAAYFCVDKAENCLDYPLSSTEKESEFDCDFSKMVQLVISIISPVCNGLNTHLLYQMDTNHAAVSVCFTYNCVF